MGSKMLTSLCFLLPLSFCIICVHGAMKHQHRSLCHESEGSTLLQFKQSFFINRSATIDASIDASPGSRQVHPKTLSWNSTHGDCCRWDGVTCDSVTGHVVALDLSFSCLYGSIDSSCALFRLLHLQKLNLAFNHFNYSPIPPEIGLLSRLTHLNLSYSSFAGQIPPQVSELSKLVSLSFSGNPLLRLSQNVGLGGLVRNLTSIQYLHLNQVSISSTIPSSFANLSSLIHLSLLNCGLSGQFPRNIFNLPNIQIIRLGFNPNLTGRLPEFEKDSPLKIMGLFETGTSGEIPNSIGNLVSLTSLNIAYCNFHGSIPESLSNLTQLSVLRLSYNNFHWRSFPSWIGKLSKLEQLDLGQSNLDGEIPTSLSNMTRLSFLGLESNQFVGGLPSWLGNLTYLEQLSVNNNSLHGPIPNSIFELVDLKFLELSGNRLSGTLEFDRFVNLRNLKFLQLSGNKLSVLANTSIFHSQFPNYTALGLASCNLLRFPEFLRSQNELQLLELDHNNIGGLIPKWLWNVSTKALLSITLGNNSLTGFEQSPLLLPWERLQVLILNSNKLRGSLPIPPSSIIYYDVSGNSFTGNLSPMICGMQNLQVFDVSANNLHGTIPDSFKRNSPLRNINLSRNNLCGCLPRSLVNCKLLQILDVSNNQINDTFPSWLGVIPKLHILVLQSNRFHGVIGNFNVGSRKGTNSSYWNAMKISNVDSSTYMSLFININIKISTLAIVVRYTHISQYSIRVTSKGVETQYVGILDTFKIIDLSDNKFLGWIPESLGDLRGVHLLNLSHNDLIGSIPSSLGNLMDLEALDLSYNKLWGKIPEQLTELTFLELLNVSYNNLSGTIPHGKQFNTFDKYSYMGNSELCGDPLPKKCGVLPKPPSTEVGEEDSENAIEFDWIAICVGYVGGLVVGLVIGITLTRWKHEWFLNTHGRRQSRHIKVKRRR